MQTELQHQIGEYQGPVGPYQAMPPLSSTTLEIKTRRGFGKGGDPNTPLYATGDFSKSIQYHADQASLSVEIGTNQKYIAYTELGTPQMPPRPIFGPVLLHVMPRLLPMIALQSAMTLGGLKAATFTTRGVSAELG